VPVAGREVSYHTQVPPPFSSSETPGGLSGQPSSPRELPSAALTLPQLPVPRKNPPEPPGTKQGCGHPPSPSSAAGTTLAELTAPGLWSVPHPRLADTHSRPAWAEPPAGEGARQGGGGAGPALGQGQTRSPTDASCARLGFSEPRTPAHRASRLQPAGSAPIPTVSLGSQACLVPAQRTPRPNNVRGRVPCGEARGLVAVGPHLPAHFRFCKCFWALQTGDQETVALDFGSASDSGAPRDRTTRAPNGTFQEASPSQPAPGQGRGRPPGSGVYRSDCGTARAFHQDRQNHPSRPTQAGVLHQTQQTFLSPSPSHLKYNFKQTKQNKTCMLPALPLVLDVCSFCYQNKNTYRAEGAHSFQCINDS